MKQNQNQTGRPATAKARLSFAIALALWIGCLTGLLAQTVPDLMNYQGILLKGDGTPVPAMPTDVKFRIWSLPEGGVLLWGRTHTLTPDTNGAFNVVLMDGGSPITADIPAPAFTNLTAVFTDTGSDSRYLELTVAGSTAIRPRQRFVASPYAFLAHDVTTARKNFTVNGTLTVGGGTNIQPLNVTGAASVGGTLTVDGAAKVASLTTTGAVTAASFAGSGANLTGIDTNSLVQQVVEALCPPGTIVAFGGTTVPSGWLLCDGASVSRTTHARLFSAISTNWGTANATVFNLPDLRGMFLRGVNGNRTGSYADPDANGRQANPGGNPGNGVGSLQDDTFQNVVGSIGDVNTWGAVRGTPTGPFYTESASVSLGLAGSSNHDPFATLKMDLSRTARTSTETRPNNAYVNYIIKY